MTYKTREELTDALQRAGHTLTGSTFNQCTIDGDMIMRYGMRIHTLTTPLVKVYFDAIAIERDSKLAVLWRGQHQVAEIPPRREK